MLSGDPRSGGSPLAEILLQLFFSVPICSYCLFCRRRAFFFLGGWGLRFRDRLLLGQYLFLLLCLVFLFDRCISYSRWLYFFFPLSCRRIRYPTQRFIL